MVGAGLVLSPLAASAQQGPRLGQASPGVGNPGRFSETRTAPPSPATPPALGPRTLQEALAAAYANNPQLQAARAQLRATDENVQQALAGWRPQVVVAGTGGYGDGYYRQFSSSVSQTTGQRVGAYNNQRTNRDIGTANVTVTQPIYRGGRTRASTSRAESQVRAQRARLIAQEQQTFTDAINA